MVQQRFRPRLQTTTVDVTTINTINKLIDNHEAMSQGRAIDLLANHFRLTKSQKSSEDLEAFLKELSKEFDERLAEAKESFILAVRQRLEIKESSYSADTAEAESNLEEENKPEKSFDELLAMVPSRRPEQIEAWAESWKDAIEATNHSVDEFVAAKMLSLQHPTFSPAPTPPTPQPQPKAQPAPARPKEQVLLDDLSDAMVLYWRETMRPNSMAIGSKEFHVAHRWQQFDDFLQTQDNGRRGALNVTVIERLVTEAGNRKFQAEMYVTEASRIRREAVRIVEQMQETLKREGKA